MAGYLTFECTLVMLAGLLPKEAKGHHSPDMQQGTGMAHAESWHLLQDTCWQYLTDMLFFPLTCSRTSENKSHEWMHCFRLMYGEVGHWRPSCR